MNIVPGTDKRFGVTIKASGVALPYSTLFDYQFIVYHECEGQKQQVWTFEKNGTGLTAITVDGLITNKAYAVLNRNLTSSLKPGKFYLEVKVKLTASSEFIDLKAVKGQTDVYLSDVGISAKPKTML